MPTTIDYIVYECVNCAHSGKYHSTSCTMKAVTKTALWEDVTGIQLRGGSTYEIAK